MSLVIPAEIKIGGTLTKRSLKKLANAIRDDCAGPGDSYAEADLEQIVEELEAAARERRPAAFSDSEAIYGMFIATEKCCLDLGLSFCRHTDAKGESSAEIVAFLPEALNDGTLQHISSDQAGNVLVPLTEVLSKKADPKYAAIHQGPPPLVIGKPLVGKITKHTQKIAEEAIRQILEEEFAETQYARAAYRLNAIGCDFQSFWKFVQSDVGKAFPSSITTNIMNVLKNLEVGGMQFAIKKERFRQSLFRI